MDDAWRQLLINLQGFIAAPDGSRSQSASLDHRRFTAHAIKSRANPKVDAAMAVLLLGVPTPNGYAARRTSFNATLSFAFRVLTR